MVIFGIVGRVNARSFIHVVPRVQRIQLILIINARVGLLVREFPLCRARNNTLKKFLK